MIQALLLALGCGAGSLEIPEEQPALPYAFVRAAGPLPAPADLLALGDGSVLVAGLYGDLLRVDPDSGEILGQSLVPGVEVGGEQGLLAIEVDDWENPTRLYAFRTIVEQRRNALSSFALQTKPLALSDERLLAEIAKPYPVHAHNGGDLLWWTAPGAEEPSLLLSVGDGDPKREVRPSRDPDSWLGKVLSVDPSGEREPEVIAQGLRNPWRMSRCGSSVCIGDVGLGSYEEIDRLEEPGADFGWPEHEGPGGAEGLVDPMHGWAHGGSSWCEEDPLGCSELAGSGPRTVMLGVAPTAAGYGGALEGRLLYADVYTGWVRGLSIDAEGRPTGGDRAIAHQTLLSAMAELPDGRLVATELGGTLRRMVSMPELPVVGLPGQRLSELGAPEGERYTPRFALWSDGAEKERELELPAGRAPEWTDSGWRFPVGTRAWKSFLAGGRAIETRLLEKTETGWAAGVFLWSDSEARLTDGTRVQLRTALGKYTVPSREDCELCHGSAPDMLLGFSPSQLGEESRALMKELGAAPPPAPPAYADPVEDEARGWLHANCAHCHAPGVPLGLPLDLRYTSEETYLEGYMSERLYEEPAPVLVPGEPEQSVLIWAVEDVRMPPLGLRTPDPEGLSLLRRWIEAYPEEP